MVLQDLVGLVYLVGIGLIGSILTLVFGGNKLTPWQRFGAILAGATCTLVFCPLLQVLWGNVPPQVVNTSAFVIGLGGVFIVRLLISSWQIVEAQGPWMLVKIALQGVVKRFNIPDQSPPSPPPSPAPAQPDPHRPNPETGGQ